MKECPFRQTGDDGPIGLDSQIFSGRYVDRQVEPLAPVGPRRGREYPALEHYVAPVSGGRVHDNRGTCQDTAQLDATGRSQKGAGLDGRGSFLARGTVGEQYQHQQQGW